jgi:AcrR family transcriptional regulator
VPRTDRQPRQRLAPEERREAIVSAAAAAFAAHPYDQVAIATIAAEAGASEGLIYRYFDGKADLYAKVVQLAIDRLLARQAESLAALPAGVSARDRVRTSLVVYLDHILERPTGWAAPLLAISAEPEPAARIRQKARRDDVDRLRGLLLPHQRARQEYALWGFYGFLDAACLHWVATGCPEDDRWPLIDAALGSLEGALGDWGR